MSWKLSRFRAGDLVEVRSSEEILGSLDGTGCLDGMPFMPEMLQFCGQRLRVSAVAHKTCDTARQTWKGRRLKRSVHLAGARCDGSVHGGCQAECNLFWKDEWLTPVHETGKASTRPVTVTNAASGPCTEAELMANTRLTSSADEEEVRYSCQATKMYEATEPLPWWDVRQYLFDVVTGNHSAGRVLRVVSLAALRQLLARIPYGYRIFKRFHDCTHQRLSGRPSPSLDGQIADGASTPTAKLTLKPGEYVRIKTQAEIERTINKRGNNRGLSFDPEEMAPYCGRNFRVRKAVTNIIDEPTGKMLTMKQPCIMLEGVLCRAEYARDRLNCPRAIPSYWREIWLERVPDNQPIREAKNCQGDSTADDKR